jgi:hypothetical protein
MDPSLGFSTLNLTTHYPPDHRPITMTYQSILNHHTAATTTTTIEDDECSLRRLKQEKADETQWI